MTRKMDHINKGDTYLESGQFEKAIAEYNKAIKLDPKDALAYFNRGNSNAKL